MDLELMPAGNPSETRDTQNLAQESSLHVGQKNSNAVNNNHNSQPSFSPFAAKTMAPNPELTYLDRVVMEIIETERMYVRDLRSIVEVNDYVICNLLMYDILSVFEDPLLKKMLKHSMIEKLKTVVCVQ